MSGFLRGAVGVSVVVIVALGRAVVASEADADAATPRAVVTPIPGGPGLVGDIAVTGDGQVVYGVDEVRRAIVACDPLGTGGWRDVVGPAHASLPDFVAIDCLSGGCVAAVCRSREGEWSLRTFRVPPAGSVDPSQPASSVVIGSAAVEHGMVRIAAGRGREWLAVVGLPEPLPPLFRAAYAGASVRGVSPWRGARPGAAEPVAVAVSPGDEALLVERGARGDVVSFHAIDGRELLRLDTGLPGVVDIAAGRDDGLLWAVGGRPGDDVRPEGLWRLDAVWEAGAQAVRPTCVARLAAPRALACGSARAILVVHGGSSRRLVRVDPAAVESPGGR